MGLGGGRKRVKIGHDPNNETWARSTTNYGHRMLVSQGWAPGEVLGSANNPYYSAHHLTNGSHSHIRVAMREDNLGLGAKRGSGQEAGECVGLDAFQGLLGRLNGRSDEALEKEQRSRDDLKRARYVELRGTVRFVRAGTLVSDMDDLIELARQSRISMGLKEDAKTPPVKEPKRREKKEKRREEQKGEESTSDTGLTKEERKKSKKRKKAEAEAEVVQEHTAVVVPEEEEPTVTTTTKTSESDENSDISDSDRKASKASKARRKAEKAEKRERKKQRKEEKAARKAAAAAIAETPADQEVLEEVLAVVDEKAKAEADVKEKSQLQQQQEALGGRHTSVRSRYIAAKRRAVMDPQALKEILMVKA